MATRRTNGFCRATLGVSYDKAPERVMKTTGSTRKGNENAARSCIGQV